MAAGTKITLDSGVTFSGTDETQASVATAGVATNSSATGAGKGKPVFAKADRVLRLVTGSIAFDTSYPTGGEDISAIWKQFSPTGRSATDGHTPSAWDLRGLIFEQQFGGKAVVVDYTNKKAKVISAFAGTEAGNGSDQSGLTAVRFVAWGG